jgi:hypothetical protein
MHPQQLAGGGVDRDRIAMFTGGRIQDAVDHQRRGLQIEVRTLAEILRPEAPGDLQLIEVSCRDLIERRIPRRAEIAGPCPPFAVGRAMLRDRGRSAQDDDEGKEPAH